MDKIEITRPCGVGGINRAVGDLLSIPDDVSAKDARLLVGLKKAKRAEPAAARPKQQKAAPKKAPASKKAASEPV